MANAIPAIPAAASLPENWNDALRKIHEESQSEWRKTLAASEEASQGKAFVPGPNGSPPVPQNVCQ